MALFAQGQQPALTLQQPQASMSSTNSQSRNVPRVQQAAPPASAQPPTISIQVKRVGVDIVVRDASGKPVSGLTRDDFRVLEDGKPQAIRSFDAYTPATQVQRPLAMPKLPPNTFSNFSAMAQSGPPTVILYDLLNTPLDSQAYAHSQLLEYLKKRTRPSSVAVFVLTDRLHMLQGFTDDDAALVAALEHQKGYKATTLATASDTSLQASTQPTGVGESAPQQAGSSGSSQAQIGDVQAQPVSDAEVSQVGDMLQHAEALQSSAFLDQRVEITATALQEISSFLVGLPGRKNLLWFSGSFPGGVLPTRDVSYINARTNGNDGYLADNDSMYNTRNYSDSIHKATNALNDSHTAVYPVDVRGLQTSPSYSATGGTQTISTASLASSLAGHQLTANRDFAVQQSSEHSTMDTIADETGGHAFYNTNGLAEAAQSAVTDGSTYYALTYAPGNLRADGKLRQVHVKCLKPGFTLSYRHSYFGEGGSKENAAPTANADAIDPMEVQLRHGAPPSHDLFFEAHLQPDGEPIPASAQEKVKLDEYRTADRSKKKRSADLPAGKPVMMQHYLVSYGLLLRQLELPLGNDGKRHGDLEFAVIAYDQDGTLVNGIRSKVQESINAERYTHMEQGGYQLLQRVGIPVGASTLRIGVRDGLSKRIGSTEVHLPLAPPTTARR